MTRETAVREAQAYFDSGRFNTDLARRVACRTESQVPGRIEALYDYLTEDIRPQLEALGMDCRIVENAVEGGGPFLLAERMEGDTLPTVLSYGHGDTIHGQDERWRDGLSPWRLTVQGDRIYGRGTADNKGQHTVNLGALGAVLKVRGRLGFNLRLVIETGEEIGSPGLEELARDRADRLRADVLIASDGPRLDPARPTVYLGARGTVNFDLAVRLRDRAHHSGNWGGLLADPTVILAHAIASIVDARGCIAVPEWRPDSLSPSVRAALARLPLPSGGPGGPDIDDWGEPAQTPQERVYGWNSFAVLASTSGRPEQPVNAIPGEARAHCQLRFVVGTVLDDVVPALRRHLDRHGFHQVAVTRSPTSAFPATRLDPGDPWAVFAVDSVRRTIGTEPHLLPNLGGSLPNHIFSESLGLPTVWVPHSYAGCCQHAPDEHVLAPIIREGLGVMAGLFWDIGEQGRPS